VKEVMFGTIEGESRRGRPCREWLDDIKEWSGEDIHILNRKAQDLKHVENGGADVIGHRIRTLSPWSNGWMGLG